MSVYEGHGVTLHHGDCLDVLRTLPDASVDSVVTDPPYGLEFMGKEWDSFKATGSSSLMHSPKDEGREFTNASGHMWDNTKALPRFAAGTPFQRWCELWATECLRVLKPGGMIAAFGGTRTFHRLACAIEDAGFEIRDSIGYGTEERPGLMAWAYGSGFPKSLNVTKALGALPACSCGVASLSGEPAPVVEVSVPPSPVGARAGAEASAMGSARSAADEAVGVGPQVVTSRASGGGVSDVDALDIDGIGQALPVVLRASSVAGATEGQEVVGLVGDVKVKPESLRDQMVGDEPVTAAAIGTLPVTPDGCGCDVPPSSPLVFPLAASPRGVVGAVEPVAVVDGHAGAGAVGAGVGPAAELIATEDTDVDSVSLTLHTSHSTPERMVRCEACGGVRGKIPQGLGTALKPAWEPIVVARKPLTGTVAANVLAHGTGALNIDGCRVAGERITTTNGSVNEVYGDLSYNAGKPWESHTSGRWPANVVLDESQAAALDEQSGTLTSGANPTRRGADGDRQAYGEFGGQDDANPQRGADTGGASRFFFIAREDNPCHSTSSASTVESPSSHPRGPADSAPSSSAGSVDPTTSSTTQASAPGVPLDELGSRFNYVAKADASERPRVNGTAHPTVKPLDLMRWLVRLVTPPGGTVLEPFAGSGTTVEACIVEGFQCIAIEREADYLPLIRQRIDRRRDPVEALRGQAADLGLFDLLGGELA